MRQLAKMAVHMAMKSINQGRPVELFCTGPKRTVLDNGLEVTPGVKPTTKILPEHVQELLGAGERIFGPAKDMLVLECT